TTAVNSCVTTVNGIVTSSGVCQTGLEPWQTGTGFIYTANSTWDALIGGTATTSAKFAFMNVAGGTPTASISGTAANSYTYLTGAGNLATSNMQTLTLGGTSTGNIAITPATIHPVQITSGVTTGTGTLSGLSLAANSITSGTALNVSATG